MLPVAPRFVLLNGTVAILLLVLAIFPGLMLAQQRGVVLQAPTQIMNVGAVSSSEPTGSRLMSLSTRGEVSGDERVLIGGLIIGGTTPRKVLLRALGPTLAEAVPGALADPRLRLMNGQGQELARNDNWREQSEVGAIQATGLAPAHAREAALLAELAPGAYTAIVEGVNNTSGTTLLEAHPLDGQSSRLMSLSTRGDVAGNDHLLIGGFVIGGVVPKTVLIRGLGPSLGNAVRGALADPWLELFSGGKTPTRLASNDQWQSHAATAMALRAVGLAPPDEREAAILTTLPPGPYTALLRGVNNTAGIGLVEILEVNTDGARLAQGSARTWVGSGNAVAIGGFTIAGTAPKKVLIRGLGPSLGNAVHDALADPQIRLLTADGKALAANNNWQDAQAAEILASGQAPAHPLDAAILTTLMPGAYSVVLSDAGGGGIGLLEVQELGEHSSRLINLSSRALTQAGERASITGVMIQGNALKTLVVRALGPSLASMLEGVLGNPRLRLFAADGTELAANDHWADIPEAATLRALGLAPADPLEAALLVTLPPGAYTVQVEGADPNGLTLTDIYDTANLLHNQPPKVQAGSGQTITLPTNTVALSGTVTDDGLPQPPGKTTVRWSQASGPAGVAFANPDALQTTATFPQVGSYRIQLSASDGQLFATDEILIIVTDGSAPPTPTPTPTPPVNPPNPQPVPTNQPPQVNAGAAQAITLPVNTVALNATVTDDGLPKPPGAVTVSWSQVSGPAGVSFANASALSTVATFPGAGAYILRLTAHDGALSQTGNVTITVNPANGGGGGVLPPAPEAVAPPINSAVATTTFAATQFLYTGSSPIQTGVAAGTIDAKRTAVIRGRVLDKNNTPLSGVTLTVLNHPEFGQTLSRADGWFDLAVNGGGYLTLNYQKTGYLSAQRQANAPWQDFVVIDDVVLIQADSQITAIDLQASTPFQVARGSVVTDTSGTRQATLLFPQGTTATMTLPNGSTQPLNTLQVRATEYTVGANGPQTMPAILPPTSAYTYAVELSVDEAIAAGAKTVQFNQPIPFYVDNFLNFPAGTQVPTAYYDDDKAAWVPIDDGRVIKVLNIANGIAEVDSTGDGNADNGATIGMTEAERRQLAELYPAGKTLQRVSVRHFSPYDLNFGFVAQAGAVTPQAKGKKEATGGNETTLNTTGGVVGTTCQKQEQQQSKKANTAHGSTIECENQTLGETVPVVGTGLNLNYRSDRVPGRKAANTLTIPLSNANVPSVLKRIELEITVAGRIIKQTFPAAPNQAHTFTWDGKDAYGRTVQGEQPVSIRIGYVYDGFYALPPAMARTFGAASGERIPGNIPARQEVTLWQDQKSSVGGAPDFRQAGMGGWSLDVHHVYDPIGQVLYQGDGSRRSATAQGNTVISTIAGGGTLGGGDEGPATQARLSGPASLAVMADGSMFIADFFNNSIRRVGSDGLITTIAGTGDPSFSGDGSLATQATLHGPFGVAVGADGSVYVADYYNSRIRRISPNGIITTVAGSGGTGFSGDGGLAAQATLANPRRVAVAADNSLLIVDSGNNRIRRVGLDGIITTIAGNGQQGFSGDGGPATLATLSSPEDVVAAADGSVLIADSANRRIRRVGPDGNITTVAGNGSGFKPRGDGEKATQATLVNPFGLAIAVDGSILIADHYDCRIRQVGPDGIITTIAGSLGDCGYRGDGGSSTQAGLSYPSDVGIAADGNILIADMSSDRIRRISASIPSFSALDFAIASEDSRLLYRFNSVGRHLSTVDTLTKTVLYSFGYDSAGRLITITGADNNVTRIERDSSSNPTAIVAPFGQRTVLTVNANGYLASIANPMGETHQLTYTADGLLTAFTDPKGHASQFTYDALGRLLKDANAASGSQNLARTELADGYTVSRSTALNRATTYTVEDLPTGDRQRKIRAPDGTETLTLLGTNGSAKITAPDGSVTESLDGPDPRFGMQSPIPTSHKVTTGGLTATSSSTATVNPANPTDPLTFTSLTQTANVNGRTATSTYTAATRRTDSRSPAGRQSYSILDAKGRAIEAGVTGIDPVRMSYDARGRLASFAQGTGVDERITTFSYNAAGYLQSATDPLGQSGSLAYDPAGRVQTQTLANGQAINFTYDANGNLSSLTPPGQPAHSFAYNAVNLATAYTPPTVAGSGATSSTAYAYNADKQVTQITRPDDGTLNYGYDAAGRLSTLSIPAGQYGYTYTAAGQLAGITAPGGVTLDYSYNGALLTGVTWSGSIAGSVGYGYDNDFRINQLTVNGANPVSYQYDADSLLTRAGDLTLTRSSQNGLLTGTTLGNATESYSYNGFGELSAYTGKYSTTDLLTFTYTRDKLGRITQKAETIQGTTTTYNYAYDLIGQLTEVKRNGSVAAAYSYDANGNRLSKTGPSINETGSYDAQDRMLNYAGATYSYSANGELQSKVQGGQTTSYSYDALGNLRQVTLPNGIQIDYLIDGQNRRIGKKVNGALVQGFLYQGQLRPIAELDGSGNVVSRFVYAIGVNVPDYLIKNGQTYRILKDHLGSPRLVVNTATGAIAQRMDFDEYGKVLVDSNPGFQPFGFAGGIYDRDTGLVRFGARDYEAGSGRWVNKDKLYFLADLNFYMYVTNNPLSYFDPYGRDGVDLNLFPFGSREWSAANRYIDTLDDHPESGGEWFVVSGHGSPNGVAGYSAKELAKMILNHPNYHRGMNVRIQACNTGRTIGSPNVAQQLATNLNVTVAAPSTWGWYIENSNSYVSSDAANEATWENGKHPDFPAKAGEIVFFAP